jgi:hypothetical protein
MKRLAALALAVPAVLLGASPSGRGTCGPGRRTKKRRRRSRSAWSSATPAGAASAWASTRPRATSAGRRCARSRAGSPAEKAGSREGDLIVRFDGEPCAARAIWPASCARRRPAGGADRGEPRRRDAEAHRHARRGSPGRGSTSSAPACGSSTSSCPSRTSRPEPPPPPPRAPHAPRGRRVVRKGDDGSGTWSSGCSAAGRASWASSTWRSASSSRPTSARRAKTGVLVSSVDADGPAAKAGMKAGDVILKLDGRKIETARPARGRGRGRLRPGGHGDRPARGPSARAEGDPGEAGDEGAAPVRRRQPLGPGLRRRSGRLRPRGRLRPGAGVHVLEVEDEQRPPATSAGTEDEVGEGHEQPHHPGQAEAHALRPPRAVPARLSAKEPPAGEGGVGHLEGDRPAAPEPPTGTGPTSGTSPSRKTPGAAARK